MTKENKIIIGIVVIVVLVLLGLFIRLRIASPRLNIDNPAVSKLEDGTVKVFGKFSCLPLRSRATVTDCVLGYKIAEGVYYGLDTSSASSMASNITPEDELAIVGTFAGADELASDKFKDYEISGVLKVKDIYKNNQ